MSWIRLKLAISFSIAALIAQAVGLAPPALAASPVVVTFGYTGDEQYFDMPAGVDTIHFVAIGAPGGAIGSTLGGRGAQVEGDLPGVPGLRLYVEVGGPGVDGNSANATPGGFNGGGAGGYNRQLVQWGASGGGATDLRGTPRSDPDTLTSRAVVAAGGGGAGWGSGQGGDADAPGGGGTAGGGAGTLSEGGAGGVGTPNGSPGIYGFGGDGNDGSVTGAGGGGGGGAGWYGGGGGAYGGGGGGGATYAGPATNTSITLDPSGTPSVTFSYIPPAGGTVHASVAMAQSAACLELSTLAIDFGTRQFGESGVAATPVVTVTNCGDVDETVFAHAGNAVGGGPVTWPLSDTGTCSAGTLPTDSYGLTLQRQDTLAQVRLASVNKMLQTLTAAGSSDQLALIDTPCPGSSGAGVVMSMQIVFVATE